MTLYKRNCLIISAACCTTIVLLLLLLGCNRNYKAPMSAIAPFRTVDVALVYDTNNQDCKGFFRECSKQWFDQTGIQLNIVSEVLIDEWSENYDYNKAIEELRNIVGETGFDIAIGIGESSVSKTTCFISQVLPIPVWRGVCDDEYRRFIRLKDQDCWFFQHELGHAFIFSHMHTDFGLMSPVSFYVIPGVAVRDYQLCPIDFYEVQKNKFRDFSVRPNIGYLDLVVIEDKGMEE